MVSPKPEGSRSPPGLLPVLKGRGSQSTGLRLGRRDEKELGRVGPVPTPWTVLWELGNDEETSRVRVRGYKRTYVGIRSCVRNLLAPGPVPHPKFRSDFRRLCPVGGPSTRIPWFGEKGRLERGFLVSPREYITQTEGGLGFRRGSFPSLLSESP